MAEPLIRGFFDEGTNTVTYLLGDPATREAAIIDPVLDFDHRTGNATTKSADVVLDAAARDGWRIARILETHVHADHLSGAPYVKQKTGAPVGIGARVREVQRIFRPVFNLTDVSGDGSEFDELYDDGAVLGVGRMRVRVMHTPGHTPACATYIVDVGNEPFAAFVGDTLFMPDFGTARADFPGGDAAVLYRSIRKILALPGATRLFMCHDYKAPGREGFAWETSVAEERAANVHVKDGVGEDEFVAMRRARDAKLAAPLLLLPSIQVNVRAGKLPAAESNGVRYLKIPVSLATG
ncbi:MAG: MBL fold metallo-hydrolase [Acetobacteraceae bacterium]|nr:MBL fold metallo-hydrolase [Acetobacteraceae bacterium]